MTDQEANGDQPANDPLKPILQFLMQESTKLLEALKQSKRWQDIEPELMAAITAIEGGGLVKAFAVCQKLEDIVSAEDLFNLHGSLVGQMAIKRLARSREVWPEDPLRIGLLVYHTMALGGLLSQSSWRGADEKGL